MSMAFVKKNLFYFPARSFIMIIKDSAASNRVSNLQHCRAARSKNRDTNISGKERQNKHVSYDLHHDP